MRPSGAQKEAAQAAGQSLTQQRDPYLRLLSILQTPGSPRLDFGHDVAPWLGPHAGAFVTSLSTSGDLLTPLAQSLLQGSTPSTYPFSSNGAQGALVLDTSDEEEARSFLDAQAKHAGAHSATYRGVSFQVTAAGLAFALVNHFAVLGSESGLHDVIDTTMGSSALVHASGYSKLAAAAPADALANVYANPSAAAATAAAGTADAQTGQASSSLLALFTGGHEANVSVVPSAKSIAVDADALASSSSSGSSSAGFLSPNPESALALGELPGESWLAVGLADVGKKLPQLAHALESFGSLGSVFAGAGPVVSSSLGLGPLLEALTKPLKVLGADNAQARHDFASWMGSAGIFASGSSLLELRAAVAIDSKDPALSQAAVTKLADQLRKQGASTVPASIPGTDAAIGVRVPGLPLVLDVANGRDSSGHTKFVLGLGENSITAALSPPSTMSNSPAYAAAAATLGEGIQPNVIVEFPTLVGLLEGIGLTEGPEIAPALPYLRAVTTLAGGGRALGGEIDRYRLVADLRQAAG